MINVAAAPNTSVAATTSNISCFIARIRPLQLGDRTGNLALMLSYARKVAHSFLNLLVAWQICRAVGERAS